MSALRQQCWKDLKQSTLNSDEKNMLGIHIRHKEGILLNRCCFPEEWTRREKSEQEISIFFFFLIFRAHLWHMEIPGLGVLLDAPKPQPQQCQLWAASATYTAASGNTRPLTHWSRPGSEPHPQGHYVRFLTYWATKGTPRFFFFF